MPDFSTQGILIILAAICIAVMLVSIFQRQLKTVLRMLISGTVGLVAAYVFNLAFASFGFVIGLNSLSFAVTALLGIPGFITLIALQLFI